MDNIHNDPTSLFNRVGPVHGKQQKKQMDKTVRLCSLRWEIDYLESFTYPVFVAGPLLH